MHVFFLRQVTLNVNRRNLTEITVLRFCNSYAIAVIIGVVDVFSVCFRLIGFYNAILLIKGVMIVLIALPNQHL